MLNMFSLYSPLVFSIIHIFELIALNLFIIFNVCWCGLRQRENRILREVEKEHCDIMKLCRVLWNILTNTACSRSICMCAISFNLFFGKWNYGNNNDDDEPFVIRNVECTFLNHHFLRIRMHLKYFKWKQS